MVGGWVVQYLSSRELERLCVVEGRGRRNISQAGSSIKIILRKLCETRRRGGLVNQQVLHVQWVRSSVCLAWASGCRQGWIITILLPCGLCDRCFQGLFLDNRPVCATVQLALECCIGAVLVLVWCVFLCFSLRISTIAVLFLFTPWLGIKGSFPKQLSCSVHAMIVLFIVSNKIQIITTYWEHVPLCGAEFLTLGHSFGYEFLGR